MNSIIEAILMGVLQGLTEFLPVSSSGHLELFKAIFKNDSIGESSVLFIVILHFATALSTLVVFRKTIVNLIKGVFERKNNEQKQFVAKIIISMIPAALVGYLFEDFLDSLFNSNLTLVGGMLLITSLLIFSSERIKRKEHPLGYKQALILGLAQAIAILPGISRSGATICSGLLLGIDKQKATQFSFLMVIPLILGAMAKKLIDHSIVFSYEQIVPYLLGFLAAFFTGVLACKTMIKFVKNSKLIYFALYCFVIGVVSIFYSLF